MYSFETLAQVCRHRLHFVKAPPRLAAPHPVLEAFSACFSLSWEARRNPEGCQTFADIHKGPTLIEAVQRGRAEDDADAVRVVRCARRREDRVEECDVLLQLMEEFKILRRQDVKRTCVGLREVWQRLESPLRLSARNRSPHSRHTS